MKTLKSLSNWLFGNSCTVYVACKMTGRDRAEMVRRAHFVCEVLAMHGCTPISPVLEEGVPDEPGKLVNHNQDRVRGFWKRDKHIIRRLARVSWFDHAEMHSLGMTREYSLNRGTLWKPTVVHLPWGVSPSVAPFEDDLIGDSATHLASEISKRWGSRWHYWIWRTRMLSRSLPKWLCDQIAAWR